MKLSVVATLYMSAQYIEEFYTRVSNEARKLVDDDYEIVLVNDGSPDNSLEIAIQLTETDPNLIVVDLSRNFGHHKAMMTGLRNTKGEHIFLIDSDLEEDPEWLTIFFNQMKNENCDVVFGIQAHRKGGIFERWSGQWFYYLFRLLTDLKLPENVVTARLMTRRYVEALLQHDEREIFIAGLWYITGFDQSSHIITKRNTSNTTYTLRRKFSILVNSVASFSNAPLKGIFYIGAVISVLSGTYSAYLILNWLFISKPLSGWTSVIISVWFLGGMIISFIGVVGIYISKIFSETKRRPNTIIRQIYEKK